MDKHEAVAKWHEEHQYFSRLLRLLQQEVDRLYTGDDGKPNYELMVDIIDYLREYGDQVHHPREDEVFRRLAQRSPQHRKTVQRLHQEHRVLAAAGDNLRGLLQQAVNDAMVPRAEIEVAAATYTVYWGNHIAKEEEDVLAAAERELTAVDWAAAKAAATQMDAAPVADRFSRLRRRIAAEAD